MDLLRRSVFRWLLAERGELLLLRSVEQGLDLGVCCALDFRLLGLLRILAQRGVFPDGFNLLLLIFQNRLQFGLLV